MQVSKQLQVIFFSSERLIRGALLFLIHYPKPGDCQKGDLYLQKFAAYNTERMIL